jgi:hypothetical protein
MHLGVVPRHHLGSDDAFFLSFVREQLATHRIADTTDVTELLELLVTLRTPDAS